MDAVIIINNETIPISLENEIKKGVFLFVYASAIIKATAAVQFLLNHLGYRHLWYGSDIICKKGVFQFEIVEVKEAIRCNFN